MSPEVKPFKVLLAEDLPTDADLAVYEVKKTLKDATFKVVDTEEEFTEALHNFKPDLIISDYQMPTFNGLLALEIALKHAPYIPFIILTGSMNEETAVLCMKSGATDYVIKEHIMRLGSAIESAIHKKNSEKEQFLAQQDLKIYQERLRKLSMELTLSDEKHRRKVASDLHDYISQSLVFSKIKLFELISKTPDKLMNKELNQIHNFIAEALQKTRSITEDLSPPVLYELGLYEGISWLCEKISQEHQIPIESINRTDRIQIDQNVHIIIFRIIQELLTNIVKHANASEVTVIIEKTTQENVKFSVIDNGKGFSYDKRNNTQKSFGLFNIFEQIENLNGQMSIMQRNEGGTEISFMLPQTY